MNDFQRSGDPQRPNYPYPLSNQPNIQVPQNLEYPHQFSTNMHQNDTNSVSHASPQLQQQSQTQNRVQPQQNTHYYSQQKNMGYYDPNMINQNINYGNSHQMQHQKNQSDQSGSYIQKQDQIHPNSQFPNFYGSNQNQSEFSQRQYLQNTQNQIYQNQMQQNPTGHIFQSINENQGIYQNEQQINFRNLNYGHNNYNPQLKQYQPLEQNQYYRVQQLPQDYSHKQDCDMTQSFYYENGKPHSSSQTSIIQQTLQNQSMNPISFKNKFQQDPKPVNNSQFYGHSLNNDKDHLTSQQKFGNQDTLNRINIQNDNMLSQRIKDSKEFQNFQDKNELKAEYENQLYKYKNEIQQNTQSKSGRKMNEDLFQSVQNSNKNSMDQLNLQQNSLTKDQQQRINVLLQNPYVMERNLNSGNYETNASDSTNKQQQQVNQGLTDRLQSSQIHEIQNSLKQNFSNQIPPLQVQLQQKDDKQQQIQELKHKNNEQQKYKQNTNFKRRYSTKSVKIISGRSLKDISDINFNEAQSEESKFEEDPQFLEDEYVKKGSNLDIKNLNLNLQKHSQLKNSQKETSEDKNKPSNNQLKLKLLQKLQQANNTKSYDLSLQGPSEIKQMSSKTILQDQDKVGINKSDIDKIKQKSLNKFDNNSTKVDPIVKMLQQKSREESLIENKEKVNSKDTLSSKKKCNSLKIQDSLIEHVRQNGFQEGFSKQISGESPQNIIEKQSQLPPIVHPIQFQNRGQNNPQDTSSSYLQKSLHHNDKMQLYNIISQENLPDIPMYSQKRMQQLGSKLSIKSSNLFAYSDTRSLIHPNQIQDLPLYQSIDRVNSKVFDKNQEKDSKNINDQVNIINQRIEEEIIKNQRNQSNPQLTSLIDRWGLKLGADAGTTMNKHINQQSKNPDAKKSNELQQNGFILKENKIQKNLESFKITQQTENKNANFMKPSIGKQKQNKTPTYSKERINKNSKERQKIQQHSQNEDNQTSSSLSLSYTYNQTINQNENNIQKEYDSNNIIKFVGLSEQINLDTSLTPNQNPHTPIQNSKQFVQKQVENIKNIPQAVKAAKETQIQQNQLIQVKSGSFQESGGNENYSFKTPIVKNRQLKTKSNLLKKPSFEKKSSGGDNLKSMIQSSHDKDQTLFKNSNNLSSIRNSDDMNKIQTDSFELNKEKVIVTQIPPVNNLNQDCKTVVNNKDESQISDYSGMPAPQRQLERTYSDISQISNNLYTDLKNPKFDDMKTLINERHQEDNQSSVSAIQPNAPIREMEKSHSEISYVSRFGYHKNLSQKQLDGYSDIRTVQNNNQNDFDKDSSHSGVQAPQRIIERTLSDISQISQISKISNNLPNTQTLKPKNQFENIPKLKKESKSSKVPKHKQSKKQNDEYFVMKNQVTDLSVTSQDKQQKQNENQDQFQENKNETLNKQNNYQLSQYQNVYEAQIRMEKNYQQPKKEQSQINTIEDLRGKEERQTNKKSSLNLPINSIFGKPALSQQSSMHAFNKQNSKYTASFTLNKDSVVISQRSASSFKEDNQTNVVQSWSAQNTFGHINSGFYLKNPSKDLPRIEISEEDEDQDGTTPVKEKEGKVPLLGEQQQLNIVHIVDVEPREARRMSLNHQDEPIKTNNIFQLRRGILENQPEMSEKNSNNALAQSGFFGRYSSNPNLLNFKFQ